MKKPWEYMTRGDWLVVFALLAISLAGTAWVAASPGGTRVVVIGSGETCFIGALDQHQEVELDGPLGKTHLKIDDNGAHITASPCPRKICLSMGPTRHSGELLACVPNRILVRIENSIEAEASYDLLSR